MAYRKKISDVAPEYKFASKKDKIELTTRIVDDLQSEGFHFVVKDSQGAWRELELSLALEKVRHALRDYMRDYKRKRGRKRKATEGITLSSDIGEGGRLGHGEASTNMDAELTASVEQQDGASIYV